MQRHNGAKAQWNSGTKTKSFWLPSLEACPDRSVGGLGGGFERHRAQGTGLRAQGAGYRARYEM